MKTIEDMTLHGSQMMASQIRKAIEQKAGRFSNEDANWILDQFANIPSLPDWEKVIDCHDLKVCTYKSRTPLEFGDMDWSELLRCAQYWSNFKLVTKTGEKIMRREKR